MWQPMSDSRFTQVVERFPALIKTHTANRDRETTHHYPDTHAPAALHPLSDHPNQSLGVPLHRNIEDS